MSRRVEAPVPLEPYAALVRTAGHLCPGLTHGTWARVARMAMAMREAALNHGACQRGHLLTAGFTGAEIEAAGPLAEATARHLDAVTAPAPTPFPVTDLRRLREFGRARRQARALLTLADAA